MVSDRETFGPRENASTPWNPATARYKDGSAPAAPVGDRTGLGRLDRVPTALLTTDQGGVIRYANLAAFELLDPPGNLVHRHLLDNVADEDRSAVARQHRRALGGEHRPYSVICLQSGTRQLPLLLAAAPLQPGGDARETLWAIVRPGMWDVEEGDGRLTDLASALSRLSRLSLEAGVHMVVQAAASACQIVTGSHSGVSLSLRLPGRGEVGASTSRSTLAWDAAQSAAGQGPLVSAVNKAVMVKSADMANDPRFPGLMGSIPLGLTAVSLPLVVGEMVLGVLTAYDVDRSLLKPTDSVLPTLTAATVAIAEELQTLSD